MSVLRILPYTPLLYRQTGECMGIPIFLIFAPKHRLLEPPRWNIKRFLMKIFNFYNIRKICILHGHVFVKNGTMATLL